MERVNLALDYVADRLSQPLRLKGVAQAACFSPFHFHRVFQALMGETLADYLNRRRLEKALALMVQPTRASRRSLTQIALACGFSSSSDFSRSFRKRFGAAPRGFDLERWQAEHRDELEAGVPNFHRLKRLPAARNPDGFRVKIRDLPPRTVAYIRVANPYRPGIVVRAVQRLQAWAERNNLADGQWLGYQRENPEITALRDCQYYAAVEAERFTARGEIGRFRFPALTVAQVEIRGGIDLELRALQWLYGTWLPRSGYGAADQPCFEAWIGRPFAHGLEHFELQIQLPICE